MATVHDMSACRSARKKCIEGCHELARPAHHQHHQCPCLAHAALRAWPALPLLLDWKCLE
eukprot:1146041-Pelagomonas_calceolata.AAC.6